MSRNDRSSGVELPRIIPDSENGVTYEKGRFLGKGGFAKCYEFVRVENKQLYAGKVVPKTLLQKSHQKVIVYVHDSDIRSDHEHGVQGQLRAD